ncbi:MAG: hypothetical protein BGO63_17160 [Candidatus Accumulibacter sp. 66-26]|nr:bifunctional glycoside hydrolase 114/ polysaccharide deacetylase family protein [Accumulibacter sp.]OJW50930.1 MAG: hypothetical protein BGO63_17160 [Candidatus Accumulibacter sp. 66-26]
MKRWLIAALLAFHLLPATSAPAEPAGAPAVALFYGSAAPLDELKAFDIAVVDPDHGYDPKRFRKPYSELYAYVAVGEAHPTRAYFRDIPPAARLTTNRDWDSLVVDLAHPAWPDFLAERIVAPLWAKGYRGFFLDTLDSYRLAAKFDENAQQAGLVAAIETLHRRFPGIRLILNRGFEVVPQVRDKVRMVAAESLFRGWDAGRKRYVEVGAEDREWLLGQLRKVRDEYGLPVLAIDYVAPQERALTRATAERIKALGIVPWVTDAALGTLGVGLREVQPRRIAIFYHPGEAPALNYINAHRFLEMPLNHLGYMAEYFDVNQTPPAELSPARYAGIVFWLSDPAAHPRQVSEWVHKQIALGTPLLFLGRLPGADDNAALKRLGLARQPLPANARLQVAAADPIFRGEAPLRPDRRQIEPLRIAGDGTPLVEVADQNGTRHVAAALMPWGGFALAPFVLSEIAGTEQARWHLDPFAALSAMLRLPTIPVPDVTTENGRRLLLAHIDGDGFPSRAELPGTPLAGRVLLDAILARYRIPHAVSVIEAEIAPHGLHPKDAGEMEEIARRMFRLPHVEVASHTFSHPFRWDVGIKHGVFQDSDADEAYHLAVPGYTLDLQREIGGSVDYINRHLAPPGKPVQILLWSGDTAPGAEALRLTQEAGVLNMNGGDTQITRSNPSLTAVAPLGIAKGGYRQIYAPTTNENIYTNLWRGPYYGFRRVIETFEMTETPRRLKPIDIYYHAYSASKKASLDALHTVYRWALERRTYALFASEYIRKANDFYGVVLARESDGWRVRGDGELRTLRVAAALGQPDPAASGAVAGYLAGTEGNYVHLAGADALLRFAAPPTSVHPAQPFLRDANARLSDWQAGDGNPRFALRGHLPLEFSLAGAGRCRVTANGKPLAPQRAGDDVLNFRLNDAAATIETHCRDR